MLKVGITGNIGSGKSTVCRIFETLNIPVFYADAEARRLYLDEEVKEKVRVVFGDDVFSGGEVDTKALAKVVFSDENALAKINGIIHPAVIKRYEEWLIKHNEAPYTIHEAAVLFESGLQNIFHKIICITAPPDVRLTRVVKRDNSARDDVLKRMKNQWDENKKASLSHYVIVNDGKRFLIPQIIKIHDQLLKLTKTVIM
jgi:dephospho-CoA kinase